MNGFLRERCLLGALLCLVTLIACADPLLIERGVESGAESLHKDLQQIKRQIGQLQQSTAQVNQTQLGQNNAIKQHIGGIELSQKRLDTQLQALHGQSLQQIDDLKAANRQLRVGLWSLAGIVALLLLVLWRLRTNSPFRHRLLAPPSSPATPQTPAPVKPEQAPAQPATTTAPDVPSAPEHTPEHEPAPLAELELEHEHEPSPMHTPEPPPPSPASWSTLVAIDLHSTEQAFAQAREGFMQPVRTDS